MTVLAWCCGVGLVTAAVLAASGLRPASPAARLRLARRPDRRLPADLVTRVALALLGGAVLGLATGWPVAALAGAAMGYFARALLSPRSTRNAPIDRTEAIAVWAEQLRDTMAAAAGLQQAIVATAPLAPELIRGPLQALANRAAREPLTPLLLRLADELADPTADLVVTALVLAASGEAQDLGEVLSTIAASARDDATMRRFVDASRARTRTAVRTITAIALVTVAGMLVVGHGYLHPYASAKGQVVLALVLACYAAGVGVLQRMAREQPPQRILSPAIGSRTS